MGSVGRRVRDGSYLFLFFSYRNGSLVRRNAFTLIEILMVILLISILAGMVTAAVSAAGDTAKRSRTRAIIATINDVLETKYESYKTRPLPVAVRNYQVQGETYSSVVVQPRESARVRLMMIRDLMRMEMPDRISDVRDGPSSLSAVAQLMIPQSDGSYERSNPAFRPVTWNRPAAHVSYQERVVASWSREFESAECLYMIMSTTSMNGVPALSSIPSSNIGDTDDDGMPEILDGWGTPIGFIRWPVGYIESDGAVPGIDIPDEFDTFRVDWSYVDNSSPSAHPRPPGGNAVRTFALKPLVVSAGPDREFGIRFGFNGSNSATDPLRRLHYGSMTWPPAQMGGEDDGRPNPYYYIDPYDRQRAPDNNGDRHAVGETLDPGSGERDDNITNYQLQETT